MDKAKRIKYFDKRLRDYMEIGVCQIAGLANHKCSEGRQYHHIFNDSLTKNNSEARDVAYEPEFIAVVCGFSNRTRIADSGRARRILLKQAIDYYGAEHIWALASGLPWRDWGYGDILAEIETEIEERNPEP